MVQVPGIRNCAVVPVTEHTLGVEEVKVTGKLEVAVATSVTEVSAVSVGGRVNAMVCGSSVPTPCRLMAWLADGLALSALSVKTAVLVRGLPAICGSKLMLTLQMAPGASGAAEKPAPQSAGVPEPAT